MTSEKRCVWLDEEEARNVFLIEQWLAAPADPAEALDPELRLILPEALMQPDTRKAIAGHMLKALGREATP